MVAIDISKWQGAPDFAAVKASGVTLVIAKQGGADDGLYTDRQYASNRAGIRAAGMLLGSYFFNGPGTTPAGAADYLFAGMDYHPGDLAVLDIEGSGIAWSPAQALVWVQRMLAHGVRVQDLGVYMSASPERAQDWSAVAAAGVFLWVASYGSNSGSPGTPPRPAHWAAWSLWQYTSNGNISGINGRVDVSEIAAGFPVPVTPPKKKATDDMQQYIRATFPRPKPSTDRYSKLRLIDDHGRASEFTNLDPAGAAIFNQVTAIFGDDYFTVDPTSSVWVGSTPLLASPVLDANLVLIPVPVGAPTEAQIKEIAALVAADLNIPTAVENGAAARAAIVAPE